MKKSFELNYLQVRHIRQVLETDSLKKRYYKLLIGYEGEKEVYLWIVEYGSSDWLVYYDVWLEMGNGTQADFVIVADGVWYLIEAKNYDGHFRYENGECWLNDFQFKEDVMSRMDQRVRKLKLIADELRSGIKVVGAMVFINEHCSVEVDEQLNFDIVTRSGLKSYLTNMKKHQARKPSSQYLDSYANILAKYSGESPFKPVSMNTDTFPELKKGITCAHCNSFNTEVKYKKIHCRSCGKGESKSNAIIRSAYQLRWLYFDNPEFITRKNVHEFMGLKLGRTAIIRALGKEFPLIGSGSRYYYDVKL